MGKQGEGAQVSGGGRMSSPSRMRHNRRILRENTGVGKKATQKATHFLVRRRTHEFAPGP